MTSEQLRMARALLRLGLRELSARAEVSRAAIVRMEAGRGKPHAATEAKLQRALEAMGVVFIGAHEPLHGPAVALRWGMEPPSVADDVETPDDDEASELKARPWEEIDAAIDDEMRDAIADYWLDPARWAALSDISRETLAKTIRRDM
jgi:transcriptional regulator with XRE-family HTH domain